MDRKQKSCIASYLFQTWNQDLSCSTEFTEFQKHHRGLELWITVLLYLLQIEFLHRDRWANSLLHDFLSDCWINVSLSYRADTANFPHIMPNLCFKMDVIVFCRSLYLNQSRFNGTFITKYTYFHSLLGTFFCLNIVLSLSI